MITIILYASALAFVVFSALWVVQRKTRNAGIVDVGWSATIPLLVCMYFLLISKWDNPRAVVALLMATIWGGRLAWHIHRRAHGKPEDARYTELRQKWAPRFELKIFIFFQFQAAAAVLFSVPFLIAMLNKRADVTVLEWTGAAIWLLAWLGEGASDRQLNRFKRDPANRGKVCEAGWWNYSRHPNYFFEWLIWVGIAIFAWSSSLGWLAIICPALMLVFLFKVTGIPYTEQQSLKSKGDLYRRYQQTTSAFVPWFKKKAT